MLKPFAELRELIKQNDMTQKQFARRLGICATALQMKLGGQTPFTMAEAYLTMDLLGIPLERLHELFPPGGKLPQAYLRAKAREQKEKEIADLAIQLVRAAAKAG